MMAPLRELDRLSVELPSSVAPWIENPYRLWGLSDMIKLLPENVLALHRKLSQIAIGAEATQAQEFPERERKVLGGITASNLEGYDSFGAPMTKLHAERLCKLAESPCSGEDIACSIKELLCRFEDELSVQLWFRVPAERARYYTDPLNTIFGQAVSNQFPSILEDLSESTKCYAVNRATACVFHAMRALESICSALWSSLGAAPTNSKLRGWGDYRKEIDLFIENKARVPRPAHWPQREQFYTDSHAALSAVYVAWRNPTMHIEKVYTLEHAEEILLATKALARAVAAHVDENGAYT